MPGANKYQPVEGAGYPSESPATRALKLGCTLGVGLIVGVAIGGSGSVPVPDVLRLLPSAAGPPMRCAAPVEGPSRHLRPWDTLPREMTSGGGDRGVGLPFAGRSAVLGQRGMAATSQPLVSSVAIDVMKRGGSAIDAAVAANLVQGLVEPMSNGIGGDVFAVVWDPKTRKLVGYNGSGRSSKSCVSANRPHLRYRSRLFYPTWC